jgi:hypothetical protein
MATFLIIGGIGTILLLLSVLVDDVLDGIFDNFDFGDGYLSGPTIAGFLTALGFGGALATYAGLAMLPAAGVGVVAGLVVGGVAGAVTRSIIRMPTDATPTTGALEGLDGVVVTLIPENGVGEVMVRIGGQPVKLTARTNSAIINTGTPIRVTQALSPTSVVVEEKKNS